MERKALDVVAFSESHVQKFTYSPSLIDTMAKRLLSVARAATRQGVKTKPKALVAVPAPDFTRVEKNLASIGFFTPSSKRTREATSKKIRFTKTVDERKVEASVTIISAATFGLPITTDQDLFLAFQQIVTEQKRALGEIRNPVAFTTAQLMRLLGKKDSGFYYDEVGEWLRRMTLTGIISEGIVYLAGRKKWASDTFHVFDRAVASGQELDNGKKADRNYVWLSDWQLQNVNNNHVFPLDLRTYSRLRNHIGRALVPLLQVWLFASERQGAFGKRYEDLCEILHIKQHTPLSYIKRQLGPSLDELVEHEYLSRWALVQTGERKRYRVMFYHGDKFRRDRRLNAENDFDPALGLVVASSQAVQALAVDPLVQELTSRGVSARQAEKLVVGAAQDQDIRGQLEWVDALIDQQPGKIANPPGFYVSFVRDNIAPPATFETSTHRELKAAAKQARDKEKALQAKLKLAYEAYLDTETTAHIATLDPGDYSARLAATTTALKRDYPLQRCGPSVVRGLAETALSKALRDDLSLMSFSAFRESLARRRS